MTTTMTISYSVRNSEMDEVLELTGQHLQNAEIALAKYREKTKA
jgi:hypothetical protein